MTWRTIRVLTLVESNTVTGPARNIIEFGRRAMSPDRDLPAVEVILGTYQRGLAESLLAKTAGDAGLSSFVIAERRRFDIAVIPQLKHLVAKCRPDILESRNVKSHFLVRVSGLNKGYPWVAWNHGYTATSWLDRAYTQLDRWSLRGAFRVVTVCGPFADRLAGLGVRRDHITVLHNAVKPIQAASKEEVCQLRDSFGLRDKAVILSVGRLSYEKGHADLLRAAALLARERDVPDFRVVAIGEGPEQGRLIQLASHLGISNQLVMAGFQRNVAPFYGMATLLASCSHSEGSPNVVLEGMAAGLPIAATAVGGVPEILENELTGLTVPAHNPQAMASALRRLLNDSSLRSRLGAAAQARVNCHHTPAAYDWALVRFYQDVLASK